MYKTKNLPEDFISQIEEIMTEFVSIPNVSSLYSTNKENLELQHKVVDFFI